MKMIPGFKEYPFSPVAKVTGTSGAPPAPGYGNTGSPDPRECCGGDDAEKSGPPAFPGVRGRIYRGMPDFAERQILQKMTVM